jgi:hypothetical protein
MLSFVAHDVLSVPGAGMGIKAENKASEGDRLKECTAMQAGRLIDEHTHGQIHSRSIHPTPILLSRASGGL